MYNMQEIYLILCFEYTYVIDLWFNTLSGIGYVVFCMLSGISFIDVDIYICIIFGTSYVDIYI